MSMGELLLFFLGLGIHLFLGLYYFHLFVHHRLLPFFFLGAVSIPFAIIAAVFALGESESEFMRLISSVSSFFMLFLILLFFLSVANPEIFEKYSQPTVLVASEIIAVIFVVLVVSYDTDILASGAFGTLNFEIPAGVAIFFFLIVVALSGSWAAWKSYQTNLSILAFICLLLIVGSFLGGFTALLLHEDQIGLLIIALFQLPGALILAIPEEVHPVTAMYPIYRKTEGFMQVQSLSAVQSEKLVQNVSIAAFIFAEHGPTLFDSKGPLFHPEVDERLSMKLSVFYFALFGNVSGSEEDWFQKSISFGPLPVYGHPSLRSLVSGFKVDDPSLSDPRLEKAPGIIAIFFPAAARHSVELYLLGQELETMCKRLTHIRDVTPALEAFTQDFKIK
jgi:hypothetical protein